jgi:hypothetical protein
MVLTPNGKGYPSVLIWSNGKPKRVLIHRLVAREFVGLPPSAIHQVNHKDGDRENNRADNLEWVTPEENRRHYIDVLGHLLNGEKHPMAKLTNSEVHTIKTKLRDGEKRKDIAELYRVNRATIDAIATGRLWGFVQ